MGIKNEKHFKIFSGNILLHADGGLKVGWLNKQQFTACLS